MQLLSTADDFGFTPNINRAIIEAYYKKRITELSLMIDCIGTQEAVEYIQQNNVENVGLHFSLVKYSQDNRVRKGSEYDTILETWSEQQLIDAFEDEVAIFTKLVGYPPTHIIGHKQITLQCKLINYVADYCIKSNCYARKSREVDGSIKIGRTVDKVLGFHYGSPEQMYELYKNEIQAAKKEGVRSIEILFHPGYADDEEKPHTSFIQERIDDINFLLSVYFLQLIEEENIQPVSSKSII